MIIILQPYLNISCGITRTISTLVKNSRFSSKIIIWSLGGNHLEFIQSNKHKIVFSNNYMMASTKLLLFIMKSKEETIILHSFHRSFDLISYFFQKFFDNIVAVTSVQSKVTGWKVFSYKVDQILTCSLSLKRHLIEYYKIKENRIQVIYNCLDTSQFNYSKIERKKDINPQNEDIFKIGFVGRFSVSEKGIDILLNGFKTLYKKKQNIRLFFVGEGSDRGFINDFKKNNFLPIEIISQQNNIQIWYNKFDLFVLPSRIEPFGIVLIEAGSLKVPVIASNVDGIPEIINDGVDGLLFQSENAEDLKNKILLAINNTRLRNTMAENFYKKIQNTFTEDIIIPQYDNMYEILREPD